MVNIKNIATGEARKVVSNGEGVFNQQPGPYQVEVTASGFRSVLQKDLNLTVGA
jgi:hypothetical protein